mmetsp:Transcript_25395/g.58927  ORF Transcript_25395/g.58927 Transcript_25395/m.58927 type:complete len:219 (+) Transcript_25395:121-777(+)
MLQTRPTVGNYFPCNSSRALSPTTYNATKAANTGTKGPPGTNGPRTYPPKNCGTRVNTGISLDRFMRTIQAGRSPKSVDTPKAPALSMAWKNKVGSRHATRTGGTRVRAKSRIFEGKVSSRSPMTSAKKSVRATTKPTKEVTMALKEKARMPPATNGLPVLRSTSRGSAPVTSGGSAARTAAFQTTNIKNGTKLPMTMALVILERSPSNCAQTVGTTL